MVKFTASTEAGVPVIGLGLSRANCDLLLEGRPIAINAADLGLAALEIIIFAGLDETTLRQQLEKMGAITERTVVHEDIGPLHPTTTLSVRKRKAECPSAP